MNIQSRITRTGTANPCELKANPRNWRRHPQGQELALAEVLERVGWVQQVVVNERTGFIVDGHLRVELACKRGEASVPVVYVDLAPDEEALVLATLDPLSALAEADPAALEDLVPELPEGLGADLSDMLAGLLVDSEVVSPDTPEPPTPPVDAGEECLQRLESDRSLAIRAARLLMRLGICPEGGDGS